MILKSIIKECVMAGIEISVVAEPNSVDGLAYNVSGFAKSGEAKVFENNEGVIEVHTRYSQMDIIEDFEGLANICFCWYREYISRGYTYGVWAGTFERFGYIKQKTKVEITYEVV